MVKIIILLVISLIALMFLFFQVSNHFKQDEKQQVNVMTKTQKKGYYFTFFGVIVISVLLLYALVICLMLVINLYPNATDTDGGLFSLIGRLFFHTLTVDFFLILIGSIIITNCIVLWVVLKFSAPSHLLKNTEMAAIISISLGVLSFLFLQGLNNPLVYGTETLLFSQETDIFGGFSETFDDSIFKPIFKILNLIGPLLIVIGGIFLNIAHRQSSIEN